MKNIFKKTHIKQIKNKLKNKKNKEIRKTYKQNNKRK